MNSEIQPILYLGSECKLVSEILLFQILKKSDDVFSHFSNLSFFLGIDIFFFRDIKDLMNHNDLIR